jgi:hypothetical protein
LQRNAFDDLNHIASVVKDLFNSDDKTLEFISRKLSLHLMNLIL